MGAPEQTTEPDAVTDLSPAARALASRVDVWLRDLRLTPVERVEREWATAWDLVLDGRRRRGLRVTLILDPSLALIAWVQLGPPLSDNFRKTYRQLLRWNDELPFAKFTISEDERPILTLELPAADVDHDALGVLLARALAIADLIHPQAMALMGDLRRTYPKLIAGSEPDSAGPALLERYAGEVAELREVAPD